MDQFLDAARTGPFWLQMAPIAALVVDGIAFGQDPLKHYELGAFVVMPNHMHLLVTPRIPIPKLTRRLKGYTAREANRLLGRTGEAFWQPESDDHWVRSEQEWGRIVRYLENNPWRRDWRPGRKAIPGRARLLRYHHPPAGLPAWRTWRSTPQRIPGP
jgi:hypothetical protein